jgi:hypothetical protein
MRFAPLERMRALIVNLLLFVTDRMRALVLALLAVAVIKSGVDQFNPPEPAPVFPGLAIAQSSR